jgi:hypothetical protein
MLRDDARKLLGEPVLKGRSSKYGRGTDVYKLPGADGAGSISLGSIYVMEQRPEAPPDRAFEETLWQVELTVPGWPGEQLIEHAIATMQGNAGTPLLEKLDPNSLVSLRDRAIPCVNLLSADEEVAARLLWKNDFLYLGLWKTRLHPQDNSCT